MKRKKETSGGPDTIKGTDPIHADVRDAALASAEAVIVLREFGGELELALDASVPVHTLGSSPAMANVVLPRKHVSRLHAVLERRGTWLQVINKSQNGTYFNGAREDEHPVKPGDRVEDGDVLIALEAMKMELPIRAPRNGVVRAILCREGELVQPGQVLLEFE